MTRYRTKRYIHIAIWSAAAIVLSIVEGFIPMPPIIYGVKLGLANIITMVALELLDTSGALLITLVRCIVVAVLTGNIAALPYSLAGGVAAWLAMAAVWRLSFGRVSFVGISVLGAASHSIGQILAAAFIIGSGAIYMYLPVLMLWSSALGIFTGLCANFAVLGLKKRNIGRIV